MSTPRPDPAEVARRLAEHGGPRTPPSFGDPLDELVGTILSQNTSDLNSGRAFAALKARFPSYDGMLRADENEVADAIRAGGLANIKAKRIKATLQAVLERNGSLDLASLRAMPLAEARAWLTGLPGVGRKTASCVLLFALGRPAMPVDTHVHRVALRLGIAPAKASPDAVADMLEAAVPAEAIYGLHLDLIQLGRSTCKAGRPRCDQCILVGLCPKIGVISGPTVRT